MGMSGGEVRNGRRIVLSEDEAPVCMDSWDEAAEIMRGREFGVRLHLNAGRGKAVVLTTDLSAEYVRINADYRT